MLACCILLNADLLMNCAVQCFKNCGSHQGWICGTHVSPHQNWLGFCALFENLNIMSSLVAFGRMAGQAEYYGTCS